jgi:hypothetical protein
MHSKVELDLAVPVGDRGLYYVAHELRPSYAELGSWICTGKKIETQLGFEAESVASRLAGTGHGI